VQVRRLVERDGDCAERSEVGHARVTGAGFEYIGRDARRDDVAATQSKAEPGNSSASQAITLSG
jgi:hypothetical protein